MHDAPFLTEHVVAVGRSKAQPAVHSIGARATAAPSPAA
jgi:hypothetical protein